MVEKFKIQIYLLFGAIWVTLGWGFVYEEFLPFLDKLRSPVFLLCDLIFLALGIASLRKKSDIAIFASFLAIVLISKYLNGNSWVNTLNGFREFIGLTLAFPIIRHFASGKNKDRFWAILDRQLHVFLYIEGACVLWQFFKYGANDHGGGTIGYGGSGTVSTLIYITSFYLVSKRWDPDNYWQSLKKNKEYFLLLLPTFFNETKISFIFMLCYFVLLMKIQWKSVRKFILAAPLLVVLLVGLFYAYLDFTDQDADRVLSYEFFDEYMMGGEDLEYMTEIALLVQDQIIETDNLWAVDIPRFAKLIYVPSALDDTSGGLMWGAGLGQFKGGRELALTGFAREYQWLLQGSRPLSFFIVIQLGLMGIIWMLVDFVYVFRFKGRKPLGTNIKIFLWVIFLLSMLYNDSFRFFFYSFIIFIPAYWSSFGASEELETGSNTTSEDSQACCINYQKP